jgi:hypothetical protein
VLRNAMQCNQAKQQRELPCRVIVPREKKRNGRREREERFNLSLPTIIFTQYRSFYTILKNSKLWMLGGGGMSYQVLSM